MIFFMCLKDSMNMKFTDKLKWRAHFNLKSGEEHLILLKTST